MHRFIPRIYLQCRQVQKESSQGELIFPEFPRAIFVASPDLNLWKPCCTLPETDSLPLKIDHW